MISRKQTYSISSARWELSKILNRVQFEGESAVLTRHNIPVAVIVPVNDAEKLGKQIKSTPIQSKEKD